MWLISARDLQFRARRFFIAMAVTALVLGLALVFDGVRRAVNRETVEIVELFDADVWVVARGSSGPFTTTQALPTSIADELADAPGVVTAAPVAIGRGVVDLDKEIDVNVIGHRPRGPGAPSLIEGRDVRGPGEAVVGDGLDVALGKRIAVAGLDLEVVGRTERGRFYFGYPTVFMSLRDAQQAAFRGRPLANAVAVRGRPEQLPPGTATFTERAVIEDLERPLKGGVQTIEFTNLLLWIVAAGIVGSIIYLSALERVRDFAVYKATGATTRVMGGGLLVQALFVTVVSAVVAVGIAKVVSLGMPLPALIGSAAILQLLVIAIVVGVVASLAGLRRALRTDPALAFGGA
jgi:putative ABC transport system permease protein